MANGLQGMNEGQVEEKLNKITMVCRLDSKKMKTKEDEGEIRVCRKRENSKNFRRKEEKKMEKKIRGKNVVPSVGNHLLHIPWTSPSMAPAFGTKRWN